MPEQDEVDTPQSGEPPPENESKPAVQPDPVGQAVSLPEESQPGQVERQDAAHGVELPGESQPGQVELQDVAQGVGLPGEPQPGQVELQAERPEPRRLSRGERETVDGQRRRFAACGRCGYFIADCQNQLGVEAVQTALLDTTDGWVHLRLTPAFTGGLWMPMACNSMLPSTHLTARAPNAGAGSWSKMPRMAPHT